MHRDAKDDAGAEIREIFVQARRADVLALAQRECKARALKLVLVGRDYFGPCPCGETVNAQSQKFHVTPSRNVWHCFGCGEGGAAIELEQRIRGGKPLEAARRILGAPAPVREHRAPPSQAPRKSATKPTALAIWRDAQPAAGSVVEAWFEHRALETALLGDMIARLRFHPAAPAAWDRRRRCWITAPAMVAPIVRHDADGRLFVRGVHCTYLARDGRAKAALVDADGKRVKARKMWGDARGVACPLTDWTGSGPLLVGEGIETVASVAQEFARAGLAYRAAAALSLGNLQGGYMRDDQGCSPLPPLADPERKPWIFPAASGDGALILCDRDMSPVKIRTRDPHTRAPMEQELDADARADFCASLAVQHWRAAGVANVRAIQPKQSGHDFNDQARGRAQ